MFRNVATVLDNELFFCFGILWRFAFDSLHLTVLYSNEGITCYFKELAMDGLGCLLEKYVVF